MHKLRTTRGTALGRSFLENNDPKPTVALIKKTNTAEDRKAIQPLINQVVMYPLSQFDGKMKTMDWRKLHPSRSLSVRPANG